MKWLTARSFLPLLLAACTHSGPFDTPPPAKIGPAGDGADVQLTFNVDQDYWPAWTQDGRGILYSFVTPGSKAAHRCLGILPAAGGSRIWELCDNRAMRDDSVSSYTAYALDSTGRLLVVEALSRTGFLASFPFRIRMFLTDTGSPYVRTTLLTLPVAVEGTQVTWLSELTWTGPNTFLALGQQFGSGPSGTRCNSVFPCIDSTFAASGDVVVAGTIAGNNATLQAIPATAGASGYAVVDDGASIVFVVPGDGRLFKVAVSGGLVTRVGTVVSSGGPLLGVGCRGSTCLVASLPHQLSRISLTTGAVQVVATGTDLIATPVISRLSGDAVVQVGGLLGHLGTTNNNGHSDLHLYKGLLP